MSDTIGDFVGKIFDTTVDTGVDQTTQQAAADYFDSGSNLPDYSTTTETGLNPGDGMLNTGADQTTETGMAANGIPGASSSDVNSMLSPGARMILGQELAGMGQAALQGITQRNSQDFRRQLTQQNIEEYNRRHKVQAFPEGSFTPKKHGIIAGAQG